MALADAAHAQGRQVAGYGISVGTTTLLPQFGLEGKIDFLVDDDPRKGNVMAGPGYDIPILPPTAQVRRFNTIRAGMGLPPDQPTTLLWMYCAETASEAEEGWEYFHHQLLAAQHHYFEWNNPGYAGIPGYEEYLKRQTADVGVADAGLAARRATQPIGTPDEIIEKIRTLQHAISLEMVVIHFFYGGMPRAKAEKSLRLFAEKVLPAVQAMPTPINPDSLGQPGS